MTKYTMPTDDIIVQEGTFGFNFLASGAISGGQFVKSCGPDYVVSSGAETDNCIGVAAYSVSKDEAVTVYGPGNIIRTCCASAVTQGADLYVGRNGGVFSGSKLYGGGNVSVGIALESKGAGEAIRVLLK